MRYRNEDQGIVIVVEPKYLGEAEANGENSFSYSVWIANSRPLSVTLIRRHWYIYSKDKLHLEVEGEGVVGLQPAITPGSSFHYSSGTTIPGEVGSMKGKYTFQDSDGSEFFVEIPEFDLIINMTMQ